MLQLVVDDLKDARTQAMVFEQVAKAQDAYPVGDSVRAAQATEIAVDRHLEQGFFGCKVRQPKPLLQAMDAQHHLQTKGRAPGLGHRCMRRYQRHQLSPWHHLPHLIEQHFFAGAPRAQVQPKVLLFHAAIVCQTCLSIHQG